MKKLLKLIKKSEYMDTIGKHYLSDNLLSKISQVIEEPEEEVCDDCGELIDDCTCKNCSSCGKLKDACLCDRCSECSKLTPNELHSYDRKYAEQADDLCECDRCSHCGELTGDCECSFCSVCDETLQNCGCSRCSRCELLIPSELSYSQRRYAEGANDLCECERCQYCNELERDCECEICPDCGELEENCECKSEDFTGFNQSEYGYDEEFVSSADQRQLFSQLGLDMERLRLAILRQGSTSAEQTLPMQQELQNKINAMTARMEIAKQQDPAMIQQGKVEMAREALQRQLYMLQSTPEMFIWSEETAKLRNKVFEEVSKLGVDIGEDLKTFRTPIIPISSEMLSQKIVEIEAKLAESFKYENAVTKHANDEPYWSFHGTRGGRKNEELVVGLSIQDTELLNRYYPIWQYLCSSGHNKTGKFEIAFAFIVDVDESHSWQNEWAISQIQSDVAPKAMYLGKECKNIKQNIKPIDFTEITEGQRNALRSIARNSGGIISELNKVNKNYDDILDFEKSSDKDKTDYFIINIINNNIYKDISNILSDYEFKLKELIESLENNKIPSDLMDRISNDYKCMTSIIGTMNAILQNRDDYLDYSTYDFNSSSHFFEYFNSLQNIQTSNYYIGNIKAQIKYMSFVYENITNIYNMYSNEIKSSLEYYNKIMSETNNTSNLVNAPQLGGVTDKNLDEGISSLIFNGIKLDSYLEFIKDPEVNFMLSHWQDLLLKKISYLARQSGVSHVLMETPEQVGSRIDFGNKDKPEATYGKIHSDWGFAPYSGDANWGRDMLSRRASKFKFINIYG